MTLPCVQGEETRQGLRKDCTETRVEEPKRGAYLFLTIFSSSKGREAGVPFFSGLAISVNWIR